MPVGKNCICYYKKLFYKIVLLLFNKKLSLAQQIVILKKFVQNGCFSFKKQKLVNIL